MLATKLITSLQEAGCEVAGERLGGKLEANKVFDVTHVLQSDWSALYNAKGTNVVWALN